ncbi:MAG: damage-inducible protein, partial [Commensalibacter sp.]|nr:damage-inducible protein [Commensalibacter sp.]
DFVIFDSTKFKWNKACFENLEKGKKYQFDASSLYKSLYRPFTKSHLYFNKYLNNEYGQIFKLFPTAETDNRILCLSVTGTKKFSILICNLIPDLHLIGDAQCFPLYLYDISPRENDLLEKETPKRRDAITNDALKHFQAAYPDHAITREDIFYYIYGLLHSEDYRNRYEDNLTKELPRIPRVKSFDDFTAFTQAGRMLADLHLNYETVDCYTRVEIDGLNLTPSGIVGGKDHEFHVTKMRFPQRNQKTEVIYNDCFTIRNIPEEAYDYIVNGKSALEWVMERQSVTTDKKTGITNDANDWAIETMHNPKYPLELFLRVITVSLATSKIVNALPKLKL